MKMLIISTYSNVKIDNLMGKNLPIEVDYTTDYTEAKELIMANEYQLVVIDLSEYTGVRIFGLITKLNPKQKIVTLEANASCKDTFGCSFCLETFNKRRLIRPYEFSQLKNLVTDFDNTPCHHMN